MAQPKPLTSRIKAIAAAKLGTQPTTLKPVTSAASVRHVKPSKQQKQDNEYFQMNAFLVSSLIPFIPADERAPVQKWMTKLYKMNSSDEERKTRNDYIWFLLVQLESGVVTLPFVKDPPKATTLGPVAKCVPKKLYDKILEAAHKKSAFIDEPKPKREEAPPDATATPPTAPPTSPPTAENVQYCRPSEFHDMQPKPKMGFIAYGSCFSDQVNYYHSTKT